MQMVPVFMSVLCSGALLLAMSGFAAGETPEGGSAGPAGEAALLPAAELPAHPELPDPLVTLAGKRITTRKQWETERRPELRRLFQHYMYGNMPPAPAHVEGVLDREDRHALGGKATLREVTVRFAPEPVRPIHLLLVVPNARKHPAPLFLGLSFSGTETVLRDPSLLITNAWVPAGTGVVDHHATKGGRGAQVDVWNVEHSIDRGYAVAIFYSGDIEPDTPDAADGVRELYPGAPAKGAHGWGCLAAWAWGASRAVDYLVTVPEVDAKRIAVVGHSRMGKAALVAAAFDDRIALAIPLQAGCGGTAPSRGKVGESVEAINQHFPHWFDDEFKQFNSAPDRLPFDQNCLVALVAPRPVLFSCATEDTWSNPPGQFEVLRAADPVYRLLGVDGLDAQEMPPVSTLLHSRLGYFIRPGKHSMTRVDWDAFLEFADRYLKR